MSFEFDLLVIGSGPAGQRAAVQAAKVGKRVAIVERQRMVGGVCLHTGTVPSKTFREAVLSLTRVPALQDGSPVERPRPTMTDLIHRVNEVVERELDVVARQLVRNDVELLSGSASFIDQHTVLVDSGTSARQVTAEFILIACGSKPAPAPVEADPRVLRCRDRRRTDPPDAAEARHLPPRRGREEDRQRQGRWMRVDRARERQAPRGRRRALLGGPRRRDRRSRAREGGLKGRRTRAPHRQRELPDARAEHLGGGRCDRFPRACIDELGARPPRGLRDVRTRGEAGARGLPLRHLRDPRDLDGGRDRTAAHREEDPLRSRRGALRRDRARPDPRGLDYFLETVFNYPTLAECYKVAAYNAANHLRVAKAVAEPV